VLIAIVWYNESLRALICF